MHHPTLLKRSFLFLVFTIGCLGLSLAQEDPLLALNMKRISLNKTNMMVLGTWAVGNMTFSGIQRSRTQGSTRYFHEMNVIWNVVNLGLAAGGLYGAYTEDPTTYTLWETYQAQQQIEKILLFNMALNFTYLTAGGYLIERSKNATDRPERLKGYGQSLLLQGGFLLVFDVTQYLLHHHHAQPQLQKLLSQVQVGPTGIGVGFQF